MGVVLQNVGLAESVPPVGEKNLEAGNGLEVRPDDGAGSVPSSITLLSVPAPPSVNHAFKNVKGVGRVRTKHYDDWLSEAGWRLRAQRPQRVSGPVIILIAVERSHALSDIDNRVKPLLDLLVKQGVIDDDRHVVGFATAWAPPRDRLAHLAIIPAANLTCSFHLAPDGAHGGWFLQAPDTQGDA